MASRSFDSSPKVGSAKRGRSDELQESPTAKRAKRSKHSKKRRSKGEKNSDGYVEQRDWVSFDNSSTPGSPIGRKQTPNKPFSPFPLKEAHKAYVQQLAEKAKGELKSENKEDSVRVKKDTKESVKPPAAQASSKMEPNTRKTRAELGINEAKGFIGNGESKPSAAAGLPKVHSEPKKYLKGPANNATSRVPAVAGPSKPRVKMAAPSPRELTPLSEIHAPVDYTFKAFPNPPIIRYPGLNNPKEVKETQDCNAKTTNGISADAAPASNPANDTTTPMELDPSSPIPEAAMAAPAGTKTLKIINKHLKALEAKITQFSSSDAITNTHYTALRADIARLHSRLDLTEQRAQIRHEMLFNALVKVSFDVCALSSQFQEQVYQQQQQQHELEQHHDAVDGENQNGGNVNGTTPRVSTGTGKDKDSAANKEKEREMLRFNKTKSMQQSRKTLETCLRIYAEDMNRAGSAEEVGRYGGLCVQYAGDLFKTLG